jgi:hypothetical protein
MKTPEPTPANTAVRQLRFGWWALLAWLTLGFALELLHGFKVAWYLDANHATRRLMFTLAHTHGTLLALVNIAAAVTARSLKGFEFTRTSERSLMGSAILLPLGFLLGGVVTHDGDPGLGILLVPVGALLLIYGVARVAREVSTRTRNPD